MADTKPHVERALAVLAARNGELTPAERQGLIICLTNELGVKRRSLAHDFNVSGLYTVVTTIVEELTSDETVQRLILSDLLDAIVRDFLKEVNAAATAKLDTAA